MEHEAQIWSPSFDRSIEFGKLSYGRSVLEKAYGGRRGLYPIKTYHKHVSKLCHVKREDTSPLIRLSRTVFLEPSVRRQFQISGG